MARDVYHGQDYPPVNPAVRDRGACRGMPLDLFFPEPGDNQYGKKMKAARAVCAGCPVRDECLTEALSVPAHQDYGFWGGTTRGEREKLRRAAKLAAIVAERFPAAADVAGERCRSGDVPPCGGLRAYFRHRRRQEPVDAACQAVGRDYRRRQQIEYRRRKASKEAA